MEWVDGNLGSKLTMKYPAVYLMGRGAHGEILSVAFAGDGPAPGRRRQGGPRRAGHHLADHLQVDPQGRRPGRATAACCKVAKGAERLEVERRCDALLLDEDSRSDTYPYIEIDENEVDIGHEATVSQGRRGAALLPAEPRPVARPRPRR